MPLVGTQQPPKPVLKPTKGKKIQTLTSRSNILDLAESIDFSEDDGIKLLIYGRSGTGKTTFWATFPAPILSIVVSGGKKPGELRSVNTPENRKRIKQFKLKESSQLKDIIEALPGSGYKTVVLDHVTGLQDKILAEILGIEELPAQMGWGVAEQREWQKCTQQTKEYLRAILGLDQHVVICGQERDFNTDVQSEVLMPTVGVALTPSLTGWLNAAVDYIVQSFIRNKIEKRKVKIGDKFVEKEVKLKEVEYLIRTAPDPVFTTKFRVPKGHKLDDYISDPTYDKVLRLIKGQ